MMTAFPIHILPIIVQAASFAEHRHRKQIRKASVVPGVPYYCHLLQVAGMVQEAGGDEETVAAAFLHDVLEDTATSEVELRLFMPSNTVNMVLECTEPGTDGEVKSPWKERKDAYISHLKIVSPGALLISAADKLHGLRAIRDRVNIDGDNAYAGLVTSSPTVIERKKLTLWFNDQVWLACTERLRTLKKETGYGVPMHAGIQAILDEMEDILRWLHNHS